MLQRNKEMRYLGGQWIRGTTTPAAPSEGQPSNGFAEALHGAGPWAVRAVPVRPVSIVQSQEGSHSS
jgi:hypothetical protein